MTLTFVDNLIQQEWDFVQNATQGLREEFRPVHKSLREELLTDLFLGVEAHMTDGKITAFPAKYAGIAIPEPTLTE